MMIEDPLMGFSLLLGAGALGICAWANHSDDNSQSNDKRNKIVWIQKGYPVKSLYGNDITLTVGKYCTIEGTTKNNHILVEDTKTGIRTILKKSDLEDPGKACM
jgi:hypothetical protein